MVIERILFEGSFARHPPERRASPLTALPHIVLRMHCMSFAFETMAF
jgi:hypothetical protein